MVKDVTIRILSPIHGDPDGMLSCNFVRILAEKKLTGLALVTRDQTKTIESLASTSRTPIHRYNFSSAKDFISEYRLNNSPLRNEKYLVCIVENLDCAAKILQRLPKRVRVQLDTQY